LTLVVLAFGEDVVGAALGGALFESTRFCAGRLYRSGEGFAADVSPSAVNVRSGMLVVMLITEPL